MGHASDYLVRTTLRDGTRVTLRAVRPDDRPRIVEAYRKLEAESLYTRFFSTRHELTDAELSRGVDVDFVRNVTLVVTLDPQGDVIGAGRYMAIGDTREAEVAFTVEEDYHGQGIASMLLTHLADLARANGLTGFQAEVLASNRWMLRVFERSGLAPTQARDNDVIHVTLSLEA